VGVIVIGPHAPEDVPGTSAVVHWQGEIHDDSHMATLLSAADVIAVPSEMDNLPMTACEAQSCGRPVVAFNVGGLADIVSHRRTGYLARAFDIDDLASGLIEAIDDSQQHGAWGAAAREQALQRWAPHRVVERYLELYEQVQQ
jgi:glycosyltransferase involved in cell wall biosynthesis